jgi:hypothetical protein
VTPPERRYYPPPPGTPTATPPIPLWVWITVSLVILAVLAAAFPVYRYIHQRAQQADAIIAPLHASMTAGNDAAIFAAADPSYQSEVGRAKSDQLFDFVRQHLGAPVSSSVVGFQTFTDTRDGTRVVYTFSTMFTKGMGTEFITLHKVDNHYFLLGYNVVSPLIKPSEVPGQLNPHPSRAASRK